MQGGGGGGGGGALGCLVLTVITPGYHGGDSEGKCQAGSKGEGVGGVTHSL